MKAKNLITAMVLPLLFSCTQDEFMSEGNKQDVASLQNRVKVGKVAFTNEETAETRFDYATGKWEDGDMFRLFLMDQWNAGGNASGDGEQENANHTHFMKQKTWNNMYSIVNNFATNIPFYFNGTEKAWENDDAIVEGNYFAVAPAKGKQTEILNGVKNRRDVWVYINPVQKFDVSKLNTTPGGNKGKMLDGVEENQFSLAYTQVYRNEKMVTEDNVLQLPVQMRPILANIDLAIKNADEMPYAVEKIVISRLDGSPMPTLAYVRPAGNTPEDFGVRQDNGASLFDQQWAKVANQANIDKFKARYPGFCEVTDEEGNGHEFPVGEASWQMAGYWTGYPAFAQPYILDTYTDECENTEIDAYWSIASWTRTAARSIVEYSYPGKDGFTPYGCKGDIAAPAYEYVLDFTDENGKGYILNNGESFRAFFTLPHDMYMREYRITMYGEQYDSARDRWNKGIIVPKHSEGIYPVESEEENDGEFTMQNIDPSSEASWLQANIYFDDFRVTKGREVQTTNAADLLHHLEAYYGKAGNFNQDVNKNVLFYVTTMGDFKMTNELVDYVQALYDRYNITGGSKSLIYFKETKGIVEGKGQLVFPKDLSNNHAIDLFYYSKAVDILNEGTQIIEKPIIYNLNKSKETLFEALRQTVWYMNMFGDGVDILDKFEPAMADQMYGGIGHITNEGDLTINTLIEAASHKFAILNGEDGTLKLNRAAIVGGEQPGEVLVTVHNDGEMTMSESYIDGNLENAGTVNVKDGLSWVTTECVNNNDCVGCPTGNAQFNVLDGATFYVPTFINGTMGEVHVKDGGKASFGGKNYGRIVVEGDLYPEITAEEEKEDLVNMIVGVIEVRDGELKYLNGNPYVSGDIVNEGVIYVIGNSHVLINSGNGIIDVTLAGRPGNNDYEARSNSADTYFRYCGSVDNARLEKVISKSNQTNPIILQYPAIDNDLKDLANKTYKQDELPKWNVKKILVKETELRLKGKWALADPAADGSDANKLGARHDALRVEKGGRVIVENGATLTQKGSMTAVINGKMFGENRSNILVEGEEAKVVVNGAGEFDYAGTCEWEKGDITIWTQE